MHFVIVIYTACKSLAKWWGLFLGTSHFDLEGWQNISKDRGLYTSVDR